MLGCLKSQPTKAGGGTRGPHGAACLDAKRPIDKVSCLITTTKNQPIDLVFWFKYNRGPGKPLKLTNLLSTVIRNEERLRTIKRLKWETGLKWCPGALYNGKSL